MPFPVPSIPWKSISMDFVGVFPMTRRGHDYLCIVVDLFRKMCVLIPYNKKTSRRETTELFFNHVWVHFGLPTSIISDQDNKFLGRFWIEIWERMDTKLNYSNTFHPRTDGKTKLVNMTLVKLLICYNNKHPKTWDE
jgi:hypothetical protein